LAPVAALWLRSGVAENPHGPSRLVDKLIPRGLEMVASRGLGSVAVCLAAVVAGCASGSARRVDEAAIRASLSTARDRKMALETLAHLPEQSVDYRIGASDVLEVGVFQWELSEETKTLAVRVSQEGTVSLPLVGDLKVTGKTVREVRMMIEEALRRGDFIKNPRVSVVIKEFRSKRIAVVGAVKDPGVYTLRTNVTRLLDILSLAGGLAETAGQHLYVVRSKGTKQGKQKQIMTIDLYDLLTVGDLTLNVVLTDGDVVNVPVAPKFFVHGYVTNPGAYDLKRRTTVLEAIAMAGGLDRPSASPGACVLRRQNREIKIDLVKIADRKAPNYYLRADDVIEVRQTTGRKIVLVLWEGLKSIFHIGVSVN